jgi:protein KIBRA
MSLLISRLKLHEEKQYLLIQLKEGMRNVSRLESQLKVLSASTFSMSSSSSLGSLSSSHASSKGSLSSLSFTDIYGLSTTVPTDPTMLDLHRRVDKILSNNQPESGMHSAEESLSPDSDGCSHALLMAQGHSPRSSLGSMPSPPISPQDGPSCQTHPPSYDQTFLNRRLLIQQQLNEAKQLSDQIAELNQSKNKNVPKLSPISEVTSNREQEKLAAANFYDEIGVTPLSPISEIVTNSPKSQHSKASDTRYSAISDESVAGDSGVFEAGSKTQQTGSKAKKQELLPSMVLETAQVQVKLRYSCQDAVLHVGIERARNLSALNISPNMKV